MHTLLSICYAKITFLSQRVSTLITQLNHMGSFTKCLCVGYWLHTKIGILLFVLHRPSQPLFLYIFPWLWTLPPVYCFWSPFSHPHPPFSQCLVKHLPSSLTHVFFHFGYTELFNMLLGYWCSLGHLILSKCLNALCCTAIFFSHVFRGDAKITTQGHVDLVLFIFQSDNYLNR